MKIDTIILNHSEIMLMGSNYWGLIWGLCPSSFRFFLVFCSIIPETMKFGKI